MIVTYEDNGLFHVHVTNTLFHERLECTGGVGDSLGHTLEFPES